MVYAGIFILFFTALQLLIALTNLLFRQDLPASGSQDTELVSVLIPARNEEKNIKNLLTALQRQDYRQLEVIVFNDQSTDATEDVLKQFSKEDIRITYLNSKGLPEGWLGKNHACHALAQAAQGKYLLFLDADVNVEGNIIGSMVAFMKKYKLSLLSIFPRQVMQTWGEQVAVPNMNYILLTLLPLILVRKSRSPALSAANGQCMFFVAEGYKKIQPHLLVKNNMVEDIEIAKLYKRKNEKVACLAGETEISCRMYESYSGAVNGFSKNVIMFFSNSFTLALLFWVVTTLGFIAVYISFPVSVFITYLFSITLIRLLTSTVSHQPVFVNLLLAVPQQLTLGLFIAGAFNYRMKKKYTWKGRNISSW